MYVCDCSACDWESVPADSADVAADLGLTHLAGSHGPLLQAGDTSTLRVWSFQQIVSSAVPLEYEADPKPAKVTHPSAEEHEPEEHEAKHKPHKGGKGR